MTTLFQRTTALYRLVGAAVIMATMGLTAPTVAGDRDATLPYHPLVYHLDLSILAYQLYGQSLVWPFDPYYEEFDHQSRKKIIHQVRSWAAATGKVQLESGTQLDGYRGPGVLAGFEDNRTHDPIIYQYSRLYPWGSAITNADGRWTEYLTPAVITDRIRDAYVCYRTTGRSEATVSLTRLPSGRDHGVPGVHDMLLAFEGGTGDKGERGQPASQSLMGFVLFRAVPDGRSYDVHIAFRGSRSGSGERAALQALSDSGATGNPDWITDLGYDLVDAPHITKTGRVSRGMARSMRSILPQLVECLERGAASKAGVSPGNIYVTGHSLGGALAQHFASAVLMGGDYGPAGLGQKMPAALRAWPWASIKLITYGAPRVGDKTWAEKLTTGSLDSEFFTSLLNPYDAKALTATHPSILARLADSGRPAAFRVLLPNDPITTEKVAGGKHVGKTVYARKASILQRPDFEAHEPELLRRLLVDALSDANIPPTAWRYREMTELNPERAPAGRGSLVEFRKLSNAVRRYYGQPGHWFDRSAFDKTFRVWSTILRDE